MTNRPFLAELKHRRVYRAAAIYAGAAFVVWQVADIALPSLGAPEWIMKLLVVGALVGFPIVVVLAWLVDLAPGGARRLRLAGAAAIGLVLIAGAATLLTRVGLPGSEPDLSDQTLAVLPFHVRGSDGLGYLRDGLVDLLSRNLGGPDLHPVDPSAVVKAAESAGQGALSASDAADVARRVGAGQYVLGTVTQAGGLIRIHATLYALRDSLQAIASGVAEGDTLQLFDMVDRLTAELLAGRSTGEASRRFVRTAATTTSSLPALKLYLEGERFFRVGAHDSAVAKFGEALEQDSTFALARFRRAMSHALSLEHPSSRSEIARLLGESARLSEHDRRVLQAFGAHVTGRRQEAARLYRAVIRDYPADVEAKVMLASLITTYSLVRGTPANEATPLLDEIEAMDPEFTCINCMQQLVAIQEREWERLLTLQRRYFAAHGQDTVAEPINLMLRAFLDGNDARFDSALARAETLEGQVLQETILGVGVIAALTFGLFDEAHRLLEFARAQGLPEHAIDLRSIDVALATGRQRDAASHFERVRAAPMAPPPGRQGVMLTGIPTVRLPGLDALRERLLSWQPALVSDDHGRPEALRATPRLYHLGIVDSRRGDARASAWADSLDARSRGLRAQDSAIVAGMAHTVRADLAWRAGDPVRALAWLDRVDTDIPPDMLVPLGDHLVYGANLRGYVALDAGRFEEAVRWLAYSTDGVAPGANYGHWHLAMARALDGLGRRAQAAEHYERVLVAWSDADAELAERVDYARTRLAAIRIERP